MGSFIYKTAGEFSNLQNNTYLLALLVALIAFVLALVIATNIAFEGGENPRDHIKRTRAYWILGVLATFGFFAYNFFALARQVSVGFRSDFQKTTFIGTLTVLIVYVVLGLLYKLFFKTSKFATIKFKP